MPPTVRDDCPCPNVTCLLHTLCDECGAAHVQKVRLPFCRRPMRSLRRWVRKLLGLAN